MKPKNMVYHPDLLPTTAELAMFGIKQGDFALINRALDKWEAKNPTYVNDKTFSFGWQPQIQKGIY